MSMMSVGEPSYFLVGLSDMVTSGPRVEERGRKNLRKRSAERHVKGCVTWWGHWGLHPRGIPFTWLISLRKETRKCPLQQTGFVSDLGTQRQRRAL